MILAHNDVLFYLPFFDYLEQGFLHSFKIRHALLNVQIQFITRLASLFFSEFCFSGINWLT